MDGIGSMGYKQPTPIQARAIPIILQRNDIVAAAQTGTGKTAAFLLPVIEQVIRSKGNFLHTLILVPTRELAIQIDEVMQGLTYFTSVSSIAIYGGGSGQVFEQEKRALTSGANIIVATPGRLKSHLNLGYVKIDNLQTFILDEADQMLDMGFSDDIYHILSFVPKERQTLLFSATMPPKIRIMAERILQDPVEISLAVSQPAVGIDQSVYLISDLRKFDLLKHIIRDSDADSILIFAGTKQKVKQAHRDLQQMKLPCAAIHSDLDQSQRNEVLRSFKSKQLRILVATDILSRGIDVDHIGLVINMDVPADAEDYIHRIGRTARASTTGKAVTLVSREDFGKLGRIEALIKKPVPVTELPEHLKQHAVDRRSAGSGDRSNRSGGDRHRRPDGRRPKNNHPQAQVEGGQKPKRRKKRRPNRPPNQGGNQGGAPAQ